MSRSFFKKHWGYLFILLPLLLQLLFFFVPLFQGAYYSLTDWSGLTSQKNLIGLDNYLQVFKDPKFISSIKFTVFFTITLVVGEIIIGIGVASLLNEKMKGVGFFRAAYFFPAVLSSVTVGLIFNQIFNYGIPQIGDWLGNEFLQQNLLANSTYAKYGVAFVALWQGVAQPIIIFLAGFQSIPQEIIEAAEIDGANNRQTFFKIKLPYLLPSISMVFILALKSGLTAFDNIYTLTGGGPQNTTTSLGMLVYNTAFNSNKVGYANAIAIVLFIIIIVISIIQLRISSRFEIDQG